MKKLTNDIGGRRRKIGLTQGELAQLVAKRAGRSFSQQAMTKLEAAETPSSRLLHYVYQVLEDLETGNRASLRSKIDLIDDADLPLVEDFLERLKRQSTHSETQ